MSRRSLVQPRADTAPPGHREISRRIGAPSSTPMRVVAGRVFESTVRVVIVNNYYSRRAGDGVTEKKPTVNERRRHARPLAVDGGT